MATPKRKKPVKSQRPSYGTGAQSKRRSTMVTEGMKNGAEEIRKTCETTSEELRRTGEDFAKAASNFDLKGMGKAWTEGYLHGLEALFATQERSEGLLKESLTESLNGSQHMLKSYEQWLDEVQDQPGVVSPFIEWSRQLVRTFRSTTAPALKTAVDTAESAFTYYEQSVARPSRKYAIDLNKRVMESLISA
jgi:hypothetical protein